MKSIEQRVCVNGELSDPMYATYGVPQGTVLGPILFTLYINSLLALKTKGKIISFADDTAIFYEGETWQSLKCEAENEFKAIEQWLRHNKLTLNLGKTKYLPFSSYASGLPDMGSLILGENSYIPEADSVRYLGIVIDRHLKWDLQVGNIVKKLRSMLFRFKRLRDFIDQKHLRILYYALVQSQLAYGIVGWGGVCDKHLENLNVVHRWILRIMFRKPLRYSNDILYTESGFFDLRQLFCMCMLMRIKERKITTEPISHSYSTRNKETFLSVPRCEKTIGQRQCDYLSPRLYGLLPLEIRAINSIRLFKKKTKHWILSSERKLFHGLINQSCQW